MVQKKTKRRITKSSKRRLLTLGVLSIVLFIFFCFNVLSYSYKIISLSNEEKKLKEELDSLKTEREYLLVDIEKLQDPDYLARYARKTYYYTKDGEYVLKLDKDNLLSSNDTLVSDTESKLEELTIVIGKYKYVIVGSVTSLSILFILLIRKRRS